MKALFAKHREIIMYLIFGVLTTVVGIGTYTLIFIFAEHGLKLDLSDKGTPLYLAVYLSAQILHWIAAVLFAFFTNKKWVFTDARPEPIGRQLIIFAGSRVATLLLDIGATYVAVLLFAAIWPEGFTLIVRFTPDVLAKIVTAVLVVIANYVLSKLFVFKKKTDAPDERTNN